MPYLPFDQRCILIPSAGTNDPVGSQQAQQAIMELQAMVARAQAGSDAFLDRTPWDFSELGLNLMKEVQQASGGGSHGGTPGYGANQPGAFDAPGWASRFVTGPGGHTYFWPWNPRWAPPGGSPGAGSTPYGAGGVPSSPSEWFRWYRDGGARGSPGAGSTPYGAGGVPSSPSEWFRWYRDGGARGMLGRGGGPSVGASGPCSAPSGCGPSPCDPEDYIAADVVASDELPGGPASLGAPPLPSMTTQQGVSVPVLLPPVGPLPIARSGVGEWTPSVAQPGAVPADCLAAQRSLSGIPWWLWLLGALAVGAIVSDEKQTRRSSGQKRAA
jgi:hypothetical protein